MCRFLVVAVLLCLPSTAFAAEFQVKDGDRVVLVGSTLIEREQRYGYWETLLTARFPDKNVTFRNLGWSGDTVWGESRASFDFDKPNEGFRRLVEHTLALKPTVIFVGYGTNESFAGERGLPRFLDGVNKLLDKLAETKARIVIMSPLGMEQRRRPPLPDPTAANHNLQIYAETLAKVAKQRGHRFVDLFNIPGPAEGT